MAPLQGSQMEYQHFIPQFILRNFSHKFQPSSKSKRRKKDKKTNLYPNDPALHIIDLKTEPPEIRETPVKRTFGMMDMYKDVTNPKDHNFLEKEIGKLESRVSTILAGIKKAFESGQSTFSMVRAERDILRKFLFLMKYRGSDYHRRFRGDESGDYTQDDEIPFKKYMHDKGYKEPTRVWFEAIKAILELKMDMEREWHAKLMAEIYPDDAKWFIMHVESYFLAFCTPDDHNDEFFLTENCYHVYEGPGSTMLRKETEKFELTAWTSYHEFGPITPKLILILRSGMLPEPEEDADEGVREWRRTLYETNSSFHIEPDGVTSPLHDLPVTKARNSYSEVTAEGIRLLPGEDGSRRLSHKFTFSFFKIGKDHVRTIQSVFLENAYLTSTIAFSSQIAMIKSLKHYLELPTGRGFKVVFQQESAVRLQYLKKLESVVKAAGTDVQLLYSEIPKYSEAVEKAMNEARQRFARITLENLPAQPSKSMQAYYELGGTQDKLIEDMDQAGKMRFLRIKIDVWTQGLNDAGRERVRENLRDVFCELLPRRLWIYLKQCRAMSLGEPGSLAKTADRTMMEGPEDVIAKVCHVVRPQRLGLLLHFTVMQDIRHRKNPGINPTSDYSLDIKGMMKLQTIKTLAFSPVGNLCNCGIRAIEDAALRVSPMIRETKSYLYYSNRAWSLDENIDLLTRTFVREEMQTLLADQLSKALIQELSDVLFNIVYPAYPKSMLHQRPS